MESWSRPDLPELPGTPPPLRLYDTSAQQVRPVAAGRKASLYVCGITPYDATHLGHASTFLAFDTVQRVLIDAGHDVRYVQNVTDVDDPLLERAVATGHDWRDLAAEQTALFRRDMADLAILPPQDYLGVVESIDLIAEEIGLLLDRGDAYRLGSDIYFRAGADPRFGSVAGLDEHTMRALFAERGGDPDRPGKQDPLDSLLWSGIRPGEPAWETALGHGRPGWHVECVAIALDRLGMGFDIQGGGRDLAFPHHEMGSSLGFALTGQRPYARHYVHAGLVGYQGQKMSKSLGNLVLVSELTRAGHDPNAIRLALLAQHYRQDWMWTGEQLIEATERLESWRRATTGALGPDPAPVLGQMRLALADDLDTASALRAVDRWATQATTIGGRHDTQPVRHAVQALLGIFV